MKSPHFWRNVGITVFAICCVVASIWLKFLYTPVVLNEQGLRYQVKFGATPQSVIEDLTQQRVIHHPWLFRVLARIRGDAKSLKAGEYLFAKGATPVKMLDQMVTGSGILYQSFTIVNGWSFQQLREALAQQKEMRHTLNNISDAELMQRLGVPKVHPEGQFYPATYYYILGSSDFGLLKRAFLMMQKKVNEAWDRRAANLPFKTPYEALIAASLVEKEAYLDTERPIIAGVMINRLRQNMLLQFDPTVIYGLGSNYTGKIYKTDLQEKTPYNTYVNKGLPPTPIAMPGLASIIAVLHPANHPYLYFVAKGDGSHQFSETLGEHHHAVNEAKKTHESSFFNVNLIKGYITHKWGVI